MWLAKVGYERIEEIEDPEKGQDRIKSYYEMKGYPKEWIDNQLRGIAIRQDLVVNGGGGTYRKVKNLRF